jgi:hypothetical protein
LRRLRAALTYASPSIRFSGGSILVVCAGWSQISNHRGDDSRDEIVLGVNGWALLWGGYAADIPGSSPAQDMRRWSSSCPCLSRPRDGRSSTSRREADAEATTLLCPSKSRQTLPKVVRSWGRCCWSGARAAIHGVVKDPIALCKIIKCNPLLENLLLLRPMLVAINIDVSRYILILDTFILVASNMNRRDFMTFPCSKKKT